MSILSKFSLREIEVEIMRTKWVVQQCGRRRSLCRFTSPLYMKEYRIHHETFVQEVFGFGGHVCRHVRRDGWCFAFIAKLMSTKFETCYLEHCSNSFVVRPGPFAGKHF